MPNYVGEKAIVAGPEIDQEIPVNLGKILQVHQRILVIAGKGEAALQRGADEALMVVGSRVEQVAEDFFFGPFVRAWTRGGVGVIELQQQRFGLGHGAAKIGSDGRKWIVHSMILRVVSPPTGLDVLQLYPECFRAGQPLLGTFSARFFVIVYDCQGFKVLIPAIRTSLVLRVTKVKL